MGRQKQDRKEESVEEGKREASVVREGRMEARRRGERDGRGRGRWWSEKQVEGNREDGKTAATQLFGCTQAPFCEEGLWNALYRPPTSAKIQGREDVQA